MAVCQIVKTQLGLGRMAMTAGSWLSLMAPFQWQGIWRGGHPSMSSKKEGGKGPWIGKKVA